MTWLYSFFAAALSALAGLLLAGTIANACTSWYHISSREGGSGFFVLFMGVGGGIAGFIVGLVTARMISVQLGPSLGKELAAALGMVLAIAGISALLCRFLADVPPTIEGRELKLEVEFRFPDSAKDKQPPTAQCEWEFTFASLAGTTLRTREMGTIQNKAARFEQGQWIVPATVDLFTERGSRSVSLTQKSAKESLGFLLTIPPRPGTAMLEWSPWIPRQQADGKPWPPNKMSCRFRLQKVPPPPSAKSHDQHQAEVTAEKEAEFAAIPADSPIEAWFPYIAYEQAFTKRAITAIANRPNLVSELSELVLNEKAERAHAALHCISLLPTPPRELIPVVQASGRQIAAHISKFNQTPKSEDPDFATAVDPATRFYGWIPAAKTLRERCGADLTPELKTILELSRVRPESHCMRSDIGRLASFHLHQWAGIEPLPTDAKMG